MSSYAQGSIADATEYEWAGQTAGTESPFRDAEAGEEPSAGEDTRELEGSYAAETPFVAGEALGAAGDGMYAGDIHELLAELYDTEFDSNLLELADAAAEAARESPMVQGEDASAEAEQYVREWLEPLHREAQAMLEAVGEAFEGRDLAEVGELELDEAFAPHEPVATGENPVFENFLSGLWKKAKSVVSGAADLAKRGIKAIGSLLPINIILSRLKALVKPLLERVLQLALNRLPPELRPGAEQLKRRLFGEVTSEEDEEEAPFVGLVPTTVDVGDVQREFDANAASLLLSSDEAEQDAILGEAYEATDQGEDPINELAQARERFVAELRALPPGGDPLPAVQNFVPVVMAAMPLIRMGISLIGRDRVVNFISQFVAQMIRPYTGDQAPALAKAIASAGLGLMSLEAPVDPREVASTVLAGTVEDTVRRVGEHADESLEHPELLEATVASAFDEAAAQHFPPALLKPRLRKHAGKGMWVRLPLVRWYRRYTRALTARITPAIARQVHVFGGTTLEAFLRDHYGITGEVTAAAHLYEALPGGTLGRIAAHERQTTGLGHARAYWKLLPLTPEAAGLLFGEPGLGRSVDPGYLARPGRIGVGQRFYYLELARARAAAGPAAAPLAAVGSVATAVGSAVAAAAAATPRSSQVNVLLNPSRHRIRVALYLSEADAQETAALVRDKDLLGAAKSLRQRLHDGLRLALSAHPAGHLRWIAPPHAPGQPAATTVKSRHALADPAVAGRLVQRVLGWSGGPMLEAVTRRPQDVLAAVDRRAGGITLVVHLDAVPPLHLRQTQTGLPAQREGAPVARVDIVAGFRGA